MDNLAKEILAELGLGIPGGPSENFPELTGQAGSNSENTDNTDKVDNADGQVFVNSGSVGIQPPRGNGKYPTITPGDNVTVYVNGEKISDTTVLTGKEDIVAIPYREPPELEYFIEVDDRMMNAYLTVLYKQGKQYKLVDSGPVKDLTVTAKFDQEIAPPKLNYNTVLKELERKNVICCIDKPKIKQLLDSGKSFEKENIARGLEPKPSVDEKIDYLFKKKQKSAGNRPVSKVISVEPGEVLAVKRPAVFGEPGMDLTGAVKDAPEPKRVEIKVRQGVQLIEEGTKAVALIEGRPDVTNGLLSVLPVYDHTGNVTPETGDIEFKGDVKIAGNVEDYMVVKASGNVTVGGYVANATIYSGGDITVRGGIIGSKLFAGGLSALCEEITHYLTGIDRQLRVLIKSINQLQNQFKQGKLPVGNAVKLLLEKKFPKLPGLCTGFARSMAEREEFKMLDKTIVELIEELAITFYGYGPVRQLPNMEALLKLAKKVSEALFLLESLASRHSCRYGNYVQSSTLVASSDIIINGEGCFQSDLRSGGNVIVKGIKGIFKGGKIIANGNIDIVEAGSKAGVSTKIETTADNTIEIGTIWPGVETKIGELRRAYYYRDGSICAFIL